MGRKHTENNTHTKFDFTVDEGKERLNPSREKNKGMHRRGKVDEKSCATFLLCDPGWYIQRTNLTSIINGEKTQKHNSNTHQPSAERGYFK